MVLALEGIKIIDLTRYAPGPYCTMILADLGAEVIKVEEGIAGQGIPEFPAPGSPYDPLNRNKRSIGLNLKAPIGRDVFYRLAQKAGGAGAKPFPHRFGVIVPGQHHDGHFAIQCRGAGSLGQLEPVGRRHAHIDDEAVKLLLFHVFGGLLAIRHRDHLSP